VAAPSRTSRDARGRTAPLTERELAQARWDEATRVKDAFASMVSKRRATWRAAPAGPDAAKARRNLKEAVDQMDAASKVEREAWRAWHGLRRTET